MPIHLLDDSLWFPPVTEANEDGLLAAGGDLSVDRLLLAYSMGIFPWFNEDEIPLWWAPDPRFVLYPDELRVSKSMKRVISSGRFSFSVDTEFQDVISHCRRVFRPGQPGTWITPEVEQAYIQLHQAGFAHSVATWQDGELVGGLYGVLLGNVFFGESMFSLVPDASKYAFVNWVRILQDRGISVIDCQVYTSHLASLGARMVARNVFLQHLSAPH